MSYTIAHNNTKHTMLGEALMHRAKNPFQRADVDGTTCCFVFNQDAEV